MRITRSVAALLLGGCLSSAAWAQAYLGVSAGQVHVNLDCTGTDTCDKSDTAYKVFGGYMFTPNVGIEGVYYNQGKLRQTATDETLGSVAAEWKGDGWGLFAVGAYPIGDWSLFGKLGAVNSKVKVNATSSTMGSASESTTHTDLAWGLGAGYAFTPALLGRLEFEQVKVQFHEEKRTARLFTAGIAYRF